MLTKTIFFRNSGDPWVLTGPALDSDTPESVRERLERVFGCGITILSLENKDI